jgi:pimeloyl-ACP methyl ester carboxylesterase
MRWIVTIILLTALVSLALFQYGKVKRVKLPKSHTFNFLSSRMNYDVIGSGEPVILLHGSMMSDPWEGFEKELSKTYTVYLPHLPGFGASESIRGRLHNTLLFSEAFCTFLKETNQQNTPVVAFSLGTVVAAKAVEQGCLKGKLILVGTPLTMDSEKLKKASLIPIWLRRLLGSTVWGRKKILIPVLRDITGKANRERDEELLKKLDTTDTKALVDMDVYKEVDLQMPRILPKLKNDIVYIYGEKDKLLEAAKKLLKKLVIIEGAGHNTFRSHPNKTLEVLNKNL